MKFMNLKQADSNNIPHQELAITHQPKKEKKKYNYKKKNGRPKAVVDWKIFEGLCKIQCTRTEIGSVLDISAETLNKAVIDHYGITFLEVYKKYQDHGKMSLRRIQFRMAHKSATMAIWLGKQYLGQSDFILPSGDIFEDKLEVLDDKDVESNYKEYNRFIVSSN